MIKLAKVLVAALFLALLFGGCSEDDPGTSPDTAVLFSTNVATTISVGGTRSYYGYLRATINGTQYVNLTNQTQDFAVIFHGVDSTFNTPQPACDTGPGDESCSVGTVANFTYYFVVKNQGASTGNVTVTVTAP